MPKKAALPIDSLLPKLAQTLEHSRALVLEAAPGSGKTTRVPPALLDADFVKGREILVLEPRRLAAKMAARWVAHELGESIGQTVGYQFRFENVGGPRTRIRFLTEGMFIRKLLSDPELKNVAAVVVDEFHERHLQGDVALGALKNLQNTVRPDLRVVVMSATLDSQAIAAYLDNCEVLRAEGRRYETSIEYTGDSDRPLEAQVAGAIKHALEAGHPGDVLVFLPGVAEIRRSAEALQGIAQREDLLIVQLYGDLSREEQDRAVMPAERRKVILSTNIAETSLTIEGVRIVVDSGLARVASYSWWSGLPALRTRPVSRASAIQRAGRAGRTAPGHCVRLYGKQSFETRPPFETPELQRADLSHTLLELKVLGVKDVRVFPWFEAPQAASVDAAEDLLFRLGALEENGALTKQGHQMAYFPAHPRLSRLVLEGERLGVARQAATLAAMLSEARLDSLDLMTQFERYRPDFAGSRMRDQLLRALDEKNATGPRASRNVDQELRRALLSGFPDRVAKRRVLGSKVSRGGSNKVTELILSGGGSALVEDARVAAESEYFVTVDIEERKPSANRGTNVVVRSICAIEPEWLFDLEPVGVVENTETRWDSTRERVEAVTRMLYDKLVLNESPVDASSNDPAITAALAQAALNAGPVKFCDMAQLEMFLNRVALVREHFPALEIEELGDTTVLSVLRGLCEGRRSFKELREADLFEHVAGRLSFEQRQKVEQLAPMMITLPGGAPASDSV